MIQAASPSPSPSSPLPPLPPSPPPPLLPSSPRKPPHPSLPPRLSGSTPSPPPSPRPFGRWGGFLSSTLSLLPHLSFHSDSPQTCPNCRSNPVASDIATGKHFDYCSKVCAIQARNPGLTEEGRQASTVCEHCRKRPKFRKECQVDSYCGPACAKLAANNRMARTQTSPPTGPISNSLNPDANPHPVAVCRTPGCASPALIHPDGTASKYCSVTHTEWGERGCISCRAAPTNNVFALCRQCHDYALDKAPMIVEVPEDHRNYKGVQSQFRQAWRHDTKCPEVQAVYKIILTKASLEQYQRYLDRVEARGNFMALGKSPGNESDRWHGTRRRCHLGDRGYTAPCSDPWCSLCSIVKSSYDLKFFGAATGWGRFGHGIYTTSTSSKANDYSENVVVKSKWKALLLNSVVVGYGKKFTQDDTSLSGPPPGYDSIVAGVVPGGSLNYDELVVYTNDAVRPSYLVMYKSP